MANYALTVTPKFTPFTYDELVKPIEAYQKVYDAYDASLAKALEDTAKYERMRQTDPDAYATYEAFKNNTNKLLQELSGKGLSSGLRNSFRDLRTQYATEIIPMDIGYEQKLKDVELYNKAMMTNPRLRAQRDPNSTSIMEYVNNPNISNRWVNLAEVEKVSSDAFTRARETALQNGNLDPWTKLLITKEGKSPQEIMQGLAEIAQSNPQSSAAKIIQQIQNEVRAQFGYNDFNSDIQQEIDSAIATGAWSLHGKTEYKPYENYGARKAAENAEWNRRQQVENAEWNRRTGISHAFELQKLGMAAQQKGEKTNSGKGSEGSGYYATPLDAAGLNINGDTEGNANVVGMTKVPQKTSLQLGPKELKTGVSKVSDIKDYITNSQDYATILRLGTSYIDVGGYNSYNGRGTNELNALNQILSKYGFMYNPEDAKIYTKQALYNMMDDPVRKDGIFTSNGVSNIIEKQLNAERSKYDSSLSNYTKEMNNIYKDYMTYNKKYQGIYDVGEPSENNIQDVVNSINKYKAVENASKVTQNFERQVSAGESSKDKMFIENIVSSLPVGSTTTMIKSNGEKKDNVEIPNEKDKFNAVKINSKGEVFLVDNENNKYRIDNHISTIRDLSASTKTIVDNLNLNLAKGKEYVTDLSNVDENSQIEYLNGGYKKIIVKTTDENNQTHLVTCILDSNNQQVATFNDTDINGVAFKAVVDNLTGTLATDLMRSYNPSTK